ncbi:hypothetical protein NEMIN01_2404 [Nematocida minor]|uniref:uncharacterized protein n=1 Tax=Nematocida minor TaxID=1912983 RepID=UPI002221215C|nr:uncharacterized protein NEMIN01_2404 [Nematocida minor]KAI5193196.1 hypothetical protein NEMIN01_2404 [Nematocida minor]
MILQQTLKQIAVGVAALAYFQSAKGDEEKDMRTIEKYWISTKSNIERETTIRNDFFTKIEKFISNLVPSDNTYSIIEKVNGRLLKTENDSKALYNSIELVKDGIVRHIVLKKTSKSYEEISNSEKELEGLILKSLDGIDTVTRGLKQFDFYMLNVIEWFSKRKDGGKSKVRELKLFKLAEKNKFFIMDIIYTLFRECSHNNTGIMTTALSSMYKALENQSFVKDYLLEYINTISDDIRRGETDLLVLADRHLHILFGMSKDPADVKIMDMYLSLLDEKIADRKINEYRSITPEQVIKIIVLENLASGQLMDYRNNTLFSNLGKVIVNIARPAPNIEALKEARAQQNKILDALCVLWNKCEDSNRRTYLQEINLFCKNNNIEYDRFTNTQHRFMSISWMLVISRPVSRTIANDPKIISKMYYDIVCTHPMYYIYMQCEDVDYLVRSELRDNKEPFMQNDLYDVIVLRLYKISKKDSDLVKAENMKNCIRAWYFSKLKVMYIEEDEMYERVASDFIKYLHKSSCKKEIKRKPIS